MSQTILRRTLLAMSVILSVLVAGITLRAQSPSPSTFLGLDDCPPKEFVVLLGDRSFTIACESLNRGIRHENQRKKNRKNRFLSVMGILSLGLFADTLLHKEPINPDDLQTIRARMDKLCKSISCEDSKEPRSLAKLKPNELLTSLVVVAQESIEPGANGRQFNARYPGNVKAMRSGLNLLSHTLFH